MDEYPEVDKLRTHDQSVLPETKRERIGRFLYKFVKTPDFEPTVRTSKHIGEAAIVGAAYAVNWAIEAKTGVNPLSVILQSIAETFTQTR